MKITEQHEICEKAKVRKDGVYSHKGYLYAVKDKHLLYFADHIGNVYQFFGSFNVELGICKRYDRRKNLLSLLKNYKFS